MSWLDDTTKWIDTTWNEIKETGAQIEPVLQDIGVLHTTSAGGASSGSVSTLPFVDTYNKAKTTFDYAPIFMIGISAVLVILLFRK